MLGNQQQADNQAAQRRESAPPAAPARAEPAEFLGYIDDINDREIVGWARHSKAVGPTLVDVLIDDELVGTIAALQMRRDLKKANVGDGLHGFVFAIPSRLCDGAVHKVELRIAGSSYVLPRREKLGTSVVLEFPPGHVPALTMAKLREANVESAPRLFAPKATMESCVVTAAAEKMVEIPAPLNFDDLSKDGNVANLFCAIPDYPLPAMTCHGLRNAVLMHSGAVVVNGNQAIEESMEGEFADNYFTRDGRGGFIVDPFKAGERVTHPVVTIQKNGVFNYALWLSEMLTRVHLVNRLQFLSDVPIVLSMPKFMRPEAIDLRLRTLDYLGVPRSRLILSDADHLRCDLLYFPCVNFRYSNHRIAQNLDEMTTLLRERIIGQAGVKPTDLLYAARTDAAERRILNEPELIKALEKLGFRAVVGSKLGFEEQVHTYARARMVFGTHGAGLTNIAFAPRGTPIVEVFPHDVVGRWMYRMMAYAKGHPYFADAIDPGLCNKTKTGDFLVDVDKCVRLVERAMKLAKH